MHQNDRLMLVLIGFMQLMTLFWTFHAYHAAEGNGPQLASCESTPVK